jgi:glutaredoxin-like protein
MSLDSPQTLTSRDHLVLASKILVYGADWCGDCLRAKRFLDRHAIAYQWIDIENDIAAERIVRNFNNGMRIIPTIVLEDGSLMIEPTNMQLAEKFGRI